MGYEKKTVVLCEGKTESDENPLPQKKKSVNTSQEVGTLTTRYT